MDILFFSGGGGGGAEAWPQQAEGLREDGLNLVFVNPSVLDGRPSDHADFGLAQVSGDLHIVGHSYGGIAATMAASRAPERVRSLALFEPACLFLARGRPVTDKNIVDVQEVWDEISEMDLPDGEFGARLLGVQHPGLALDPGDQGVATMGANLRRWGPPGTHELDPSVFRRTPSLVVTGAWDPLFDEVTGAIAELGANYEVLSGHGHQVQDHPDANALLEKFWASV